jgi:hypothetical protein
MGVHEKEKDKDKKMQMMLLTRMNRCGIRMMKEEAKSRIRTKMGMVRKTKVERTIARVKEKEGEKEKKFMGKSEGIQTLKKELKLRLGKGLKLGLARWVIGKG